MKIHIDERCSKILDSSEALTVLAALDDLVDELHRDGLTCLVVLGIDSEHLWLHCPMLINLRRELNEVALNACCTIVVSVAHERVECVSELMEHSVDIVDGLECRLIGRGNCHVADIDYKRDLALLYSLCVLLILLSAEACAPCTGTLAIAWEIVAEEDSELLAVLVDDTPALGCWLV